MAQNEHVPNSFSKTLAFSPALVKRLRSSVPFSTELLFRQECQSSVDVAPGGGERSPSSLVRDVVQSPSSLEQLRRPSMPQRVKHEPRVPQVRLVQGNAQLSPQLGVSDLDHEFVPVTDRSQQSLEQRLQRFVLKPNRLFGSSLRLPQTEEDGFGSH